VELKPSFLENDLVRLVFSGGADTGGDKMSGWCMSGGICARLGAYGNGSDLSFAFLNTGSSSCRSFR
jgi:hypothetical protein